MSRRREIGQGFNFGLGFTMGSVLMSGLISVACLIVTLILFAVPVVLGSMLQ